MPEDSLNQIELLENPARIPADLAVLLDGAEWTPNKLGESGCSVYRLSWASPKPALFLKYGQGPFSKDVSLEATKLDWFAGRFRTPAVHYFREALVDSWLLTAAIEGQTAYQLLADNPTENLWVVDRLGSYLRMLHSIPIFNCPFYEGHQVRLLQARSRIERGLVDADDFDPSHVSLSPEELWQRMLAHADFEPDLVVTHGDFSLDNVILNDGKIAGCIDVGRAGIADRYQDLAILCNCLSEFGEGLSSRVFAAYGLPNVDERRMEFHLMLDEFF